jgi:hypothetical protein
MNIAGVNDDNDEQYEADDDVLVANNKNDENF